MTFSRQGGPLMKSLIRAAVVLCAGCAASVPVQYAQAADLGEVIVTASRQNARYAQQDRPLIGLRRRADSVVTSVAFTSDSRDAEVRKKEIHTMLLAAIDRAAAAGMDLVTGNFELEQVTRANYQKLPLVGAGRIDTSKIDIMLKARLTGSVPEAIEKFNAFIKGTPRSGRGTLDSYGGLTLTVINPDQYRDAIVKLVAEDTRRQSAIFGAEYAVQVSGIDGQVFWSQISTTDVFLYVPYRYTIVPKQIWPK
jgi:hypothetical protein